MEKILLFERKSISFRDYRTSDRDWVETTNVRHYTATEGFGSSFATAVSSALDSLEAALEEETSKFLIAETLDVGRPVGSVFFSAENTTTGRLRLFYLDEAYRGFGCGKHMLDQIIQHAKLQGFDKIRVSTFDRHEVACRLYRQAGFQQVIGEPTLVFGQLLRQIDFEKKLPPQVR